MKKVKFLAIIISLLYFSPLVFADLDLSGYFENRFFLIYNNSIQRENGHTFQLGDYNRIRLKYRARPSEKVSLNLALDLFSFHGLLRSPLGTYSNPDAGNGKSVLMDLDRAYVDIYFKKFDLTIGKQRVAMGVSYLWAPLDLFNRINLFEPKEEKPGTNAFKLYVPLGKSSGFTGVFSPDDSFKTSKSGFRLQAQLLGVDAAITMIRSGARNTSVYGLDFRGENFVGWWFEGGYFVSPAGTETKVVIGFDYTFPLKNGLYWLNELFFDSSGERNPNLYDYTILFEEERFTLGRTYCMSMLRYGLSDFVSLSLSYIANWGDGSYLISPTVQWDLFQNVSLASGLYFPMGRDNGEFKENRPDVFFLWLKINF